MKSPVLVLALAFECVLMPCAFADTCDLTNITITAGIQSCDPNKPASRDTCRLMETKTRFLKNKIYYFDSTDEETGTVFFPDKTVDALTEPEENRRLYDRYLNDPHVRQMSTTIPLSVELTHNSIKLDYSIRTHRDANFPDDWTGSGWWLTFSLPNCYTCKVQDYAEYDHAAGYGDVVTQRLERGSCQING